MKKIITLMLAIIMVAGLFAGCGESKPTLTILNWGDYMDPEVWKEFAEQNNVKINYLTCASNEEMYVSVATQGSKIDIIVPSDYLIERMIKEDLLHEINYDNIPNAANLMDFCTDRSFDPGNKYSVPYVWGTLGILYDKTRVYEPVTSWSALWDERYKNEIYMYDSQRDSISVALAKLGYSINTRDAGVLEQVKAALIAQKPLVKAYGTDDIRGSLVNGSGIMGVVYSGDAVLAMQENENLEYCIPSEGSNIWFDNLTIMKNSSNYELAEKFINYLLGDEISARNSYYIGYPSANKNSIDKIEELFSNDPDYYPVRDNYAYNTPAEDLARCEVHQDLGEWEEAYVELWMAVKTSTAK